MLAESREKLYEFGSVQLSSVSQLPLGQFCSCETLPIPWEMLPIPWLKSSTPARFQPGLLGAGKTFAPLGAGSGCSCTHGTAATPGAALEQGHITPVPPTAPPSAVPMGLPPKPEPCWCSGVPSGATQGSVLPVVPGPCLSRRECSSRDAAKAAGAAGARSHESPSSTHVGPGAASAPPRQQQHRVA